MEREKARRREAALAAGRDITGLSFDDLNEHEDRWFNIVNDFIFVMERAHSWPVPGDGTQVTAVSPARKKRAAKQRKNPLPRKKAKSS